MANLFASFKYSTNSNSNTVAKDDIEPNQKTNKQPCKNKTMKREKYDLMKAGACVDQQRITSFFGIGGSATNTAARTSGAKSSCKRKIGGGLTRKVDNVNDERSVPSRKNTSRKRLMARSDNVIEDHGKMEKRGRTVSDFESSNAAVTKTTHKKKRKKILTKWKPTKNEKQKNTKSSTSDEMTTEYDKSRSRSVRKRPSTKQHHPSSSKKEMVSPLDDTDSEDEDDE